MPSVPVSAMLHDECLVVPVRLHGINYQFTSLQLLKSRSYLRSHFKSEIETSGQLEFAFGSVNC